MSGALAGPLRCTTSEDCWKPGCFAPDLGVTSVFCHDNFCHNQYTSDICVGTENGHKVPANTLNVLGQQAWQCWEGMLQSQCTHSHSGLVPVSSNRSLHNGELT